MPGRIARGGRTSANSALSRKSSTQTLKSNGRNSSPNLTEIPDEGPSTTLRHSICKVFGEAQKSTTQHRKLSITLRKIQEACCYEPVNLKKAKRVEEENFEEEDFNTEIVRCVLRILPVKKAEPMGDRAVRFLGTYLHSASGKDNEIADAGDPDATSLPETPTSRLTTQILLELLPKLGAKDKCIRFRATQITSHIINSLDTLDDSLFHQLRFTLLKRIHDKEAMVRLQAVYGLGRLAAEVDGEEKDDDDSDEDNDVGSGVLEKLLNVLQNDPAPEVRRNLLLNLPLTKDVLPYLLERARDADASTRRALYARLLPALGDFRHLSLTHREKLLRWGLRDRDENVRKATGRLFCERWIEDCAALPAAQAAEQAEAEGEQAPKAANQAADPSLDALLELLERIDVVNSGIEGGIAQTAMQEFWAGRPDYLDYVSFPDDFWEDLNPELAFVARTFNDFRRSGNAKENSGEQRDLVALAEEKLPEVTKFGFFLEREMNKLIETMRAAATAEDDDGDAEEESAQREFVVEQLLHMALTLDYSDEVGRRKMFALVREALALPDLPEEATRLVVEVLRLVCGEDGGGKGERQFCGVVLEAIAEVHDTIMGEGEQGGAVEGSGDGVEESFHSATEYFDPEAEDGEDKAKKQKKSGNQNGEEDALAAEEKAIREIMVNMKCLHIALCMLQNVGGNLEDDANLVTMLNNLVVPAVRSQEAPIRERGLLCLGLCCLLGKNLAQENLTLFLHCFAKGHPALQVIALQIIADILVTHPSLLAASEENVDETAATEQATGSELLKQVIRAFSKSLKSDDPAVQSTGATALSKAMLSRLITDKALLTQLVIAYFDPDTNGNAHLRQSLSYFLPVYCHSRAENAKLMVEITCQVLADLATLRESLMEDADYEEEGGDAMVKLSVIGQMLVDWTDPRKIVGFAEAAGASSVAADGAGETHFLLAEKILERVTVGKNAGQVEKDERKVLFSMLGKLHLPADGCDGDMLDRILRLIVEAIDTKVAQDVSSRNVLAKMKDLLLKQMNSVMTAERGGGGAEETILETTELVPGAEQTEANIADEFDEEETDDVTALQKTMRDTTLGATTIGAPDAEGTRVALGVEDSEMMDVDGDEYTTTEI